MDWMFNMSGFSYQSAFSSDSLTTFMINYRLSVIDKFIDDEFINNQKYIDKARHFNVGNIRKEVWAGLKYKYEISDDNEEINKLIDRKCIQLIRAIYV